MNEPPSQASEDPEGELNGAANPPATRDAEGGWRARLAKYRERLLELAVLGIPMFIANWAIAGIGRPLTEQPWRIVWFVGPLTVLLAFLVKRAERGPSLKPRGPFLAALVVYIMAFTVAATAGFLDFKRSLYGLEQEVPRNWLALNRLGDWRYLFVQRRPAAKDFVIVTMPKPRDSLEALERRLNIAQLIAIADRHRAKGMAFDFYFEGPSPVDDSICRRANSARAHLVPVLAGFNYTRTAGILNRNIYPAALKDCFPDSTQGHAVGYLEADNKVRMIPLYFLDFPALSLRIAQLLSDAEELRLPGNQLLQFVAPADALQTIEFSLIDEQNVGVFRDRFVLVGEASNVDSYETTFGRKLGVEVHAYAVHSLRHNQFIERAPWWAGALAFLVCCYILTDLAGSGTTKRRLVTASTVMSAVVLAASAFAIYFFRVWLDVIYLLVGIWLLLLLLLALRRTLGETATSKASATPKTEGDCSLE